MAISQEDLVNRFAFHAATTDEKRNAHTSVRMACYSLAQFIVDNTPEGREQSLAITHLEDAMMWANAALARAADSQQ